jgi:uncharacterized membrane protein
MKRLVFCLMVISGFSFAFSAELLLDKQITSKAVVLQVVSEKQENVAGSDVVAPIQILRVKILEGEHKDKEITFSNDFIQLKTGDSFFLHETILADSGESMYSVSDPYRLPTIYFFTALLFFLVIIFGGKQGVRGMISLVGSLLLIAYILLPNIIAGHNALVVSISVSSLIIILGSYITHGFTRTTTSAVLGMIVTVLITGILAYFATKFSMLSGFVEEETMYLNFDTKGKIDFVGLLLGGMIIGLLGVLYDAAIGQSVSVEELCKAGPHLSKIEIYKRALRIGREHIGALINTLAIAYVGMSLPLLLLFSMSDSHLLQIANREVFATEIIRTLVGIIGLVLAVPITTFIATMMLYGREIQDSRSHSHHHHH